VSQKIGQLGRSQYHRGAVRGDPETEPPPRERLGDRRTTGGADPVAGSPVIPRPDSSDGFVTMQSIHNRRTRPPPCTTHAPQGTVLWGRQRSPVVGRNCPSTWTFAEGAAHGDGAST